MLTILKISFGPPKTYSYLLDSRSGVRIKTGDILKKFTGCDSRGCYYTQLKVVDVSSTDVLPSAVTAVIHIKDARTLECSVSHLAAETKMKLMTPKTKPKAEESRSIIIRSCERMLGIRIPRITIGGNKPWQSKKNE